MNRITIALLFMLTNCVILPTPKVVTRYHQIAAYRKLVDEESEFKLTECRLARPLDPKGSPCTLVVMTCTMGAGTRHAKKNVLVFSARPECLPKEEEICK